MDSDKSDKTQIDKFRDAARQLETNDSEENFDRVLKRVAKAADSKRKGDPAK